MRVLKVQRVSIPSTVKNTIPIHRVLQTAEILEYRGDAWESSLDSKDVCIY